MYRSEYKSRSEILSNEATTTSKDRTTLSNEATSLKDKTGFSDAASNVPHGLESLTTLDQLFLEYCEFAVPVRSKILKKYFIKNTKGQIVYYGLEESDCYNVNNPDRQFTMRILDDKNQQVMILDRDRASSSCCCCCCSHQIIEVFGQDGVLGSVEDSGSIRCSSLNLSVKNASRKTILKIEGPCCLMRYTNADFEVRNMSGRKVGNIACSIPADMNIFFVRRDLATKYNIEISFPKDLDVRSKATLLAAGILIDFAVLDIRCGNKNQ